MRPVDLTFSAGRTTALVGPSGCGKSTLLRMIAGLETPSAGAIEIGGEPPSQTLRKAGLSVAFQDPSLLPWRSVRGNIELALGLARRRPGPDEVDQLITLVGLDGFGDARPAELSGGMRQRAAIARALATRPGLLLLDEPFGAVDELTRTQLAQDLPRIWEARGTTTILVTHSVSEAVHLSDRVIVLSPRPAEIVDDIAIDLPRPRPETATRSDEAAALVDRVFAGLAKGMAMDRPTLAAQ
ncbi:ABC-type nitrate/sulfonate/bicarbonate transport system, ATPase component [Roseibacterium elongatum DSM 19469]|uniref:ABC-type nitrate/sulfonate/bicarbonate transport system, ATPase component n=1 Tax=Roseicyclus elongatus DSM 19469 TaxID=1294273 RepID=W8RYR2_9RHOB|nr:ABC-type nitrate/sulfonate/bicarbonate transport system, ATPase component [Roseibacterium elongatum DSM 19469]